MSGVVGSDNESLAVIGCSEGVGMRSRMSSMLLAVVISLLLLLPCAELLRKVRDWYNCNAMLFGPAYLVLGGIWILFLVKVFGNFPVSKSTATVGSFGGEELAWYGSVVAFFGDDG